MRKLRYREVTQLYIRKHHITGSSLVGIPKSIIIIITVLYKMLNTKKQFISLIGVLITYMRKESQTYLMLTVQWRLCSQKFFYFIDIQSFPPPQLLFFSTRLSIHVTNLLHYSVSKAMTVDKIKPFSICNPTEFNRFSNPYMYTQYILNNRQRIQNNANSITDKMFIASIFLDNLCPKHVFKNHVAYINSKINLKPGKINQIRKMCQHICLDSCVKILLDFFLLFEQFYLFNLIAY